MLATSTSDHNLSVVPIPSAGDLLNGKVDSRAAEEGSSQLMVTGQKPAEQGAVARDSTQMHAHVR